MTVLGIIFGDSELKVSSYEVAEPPSDGIITIMTSRRNISKGTGIHEKLVTSAGWNALHSLEA